MLYGTEGQLKNNTRDKLQEAIYGGVYYPDKHVSAWKNGYPEYFAKVMNAPN
jgi:maltose phosphorylase